MNVLAHNLTAMNAERMYGVNARLQMKTSEKLSSGYKINRAADDAAGLSISEKMRRQVRGLTQASSNAQDGISMVQIADGALNEVHDMLQRGNELVIKAANGTLSDSDREDINKELVQLKEAIDQVSTNTKFNELDVFPATGVAPELASTTVVNTYELEFAPGGEVSIKHTSQGEGVGSIGAINTGNALADKIAGEFVPNAVNQILGTFSSLADAIPGTKYTGDNADKLKMAMQVKYVDGPSGKLAYVKASFKGADQELSKMSLTVDASDFTEEDVKNNTPKMGMLESTIAHEMMHAVMDAATPQRMAPGGTEDYPHWYVEGSAQLTGGGFTTGWNDTLKNILKGSGTEAQKDQQITDYLKKYTVDSREYGHGYLAAAYLGHLLSGKTSADDVTKDTIAAGTNALFKELLKDENKNKSFEEIVNGLLGAGGSGMTLAKVKNAINTGNDGGTEFVRKLTQASIDGAGSVIAAGGLNAAATEILGNSTDPSPIYIDPESIKIENLNKAPASGLYDVLIQAGAESDVSNKIHFSLFRMTAKDLGLDGVGVTPEETEEGEANVVVHSMLTKENATESIDIFKNAINLVSGVRSYYGAIQNRMEHTIRNLDNVVENTTAAEARLRDTDMAAEMVKYAKDNILLQAGQSMMAQANQSNNGILQILS